MCQPPRDFVVFSLFVLRSKSAAERGAAGPAGRGPCPQPTPADPSYQPGKAALETVRESAAWSIRSFKHQDLAHLAWAQAQLGPCPP